MGMGVRVGYKRYDFSGSDEISKRGYRETWEDKYHIVLVIRNVKVL